VWWAGLREEGEDILPCSGLLLWCDRVFEVVGYGVYSERAGFLEEFGGGGGDWEMLERE
jgi:hypothetical protein